MSSLLRDLYRHQAWADAEHWRTIEAHAPAREDKVIRARLHHLHLVQRAFRWIVSDRTSSLGIPKPDDFASLSDLKAWARAYHDEAPGFVEALTDARLAERVDVVWFKDPPLQITVAEALTQCAMHSQWHRGQNAARLRELGAEPPLVDVIVWYWKDRPAPDWGP
jgi:uncharacterized damage-inducible protein DinB